MMPTFYHLPNVLDRKGGLRATSDQIEQASRTGKALAVLWIDVDRFRQINESFGHECGDQFILEIASRIQLSVPAVATLSRMSADEFICLLPCTERVRLEALGEALRNAISEPLEIDGITVRPTVSAGIALWRVGEDAFELLQRADRAMVMAKQRGGNVFVCFEDAVSQEKADQQEARRELSIQSDIYSALEYGGIHLHFQPIFTFDGRISAFEALMRCTVGQRSISPAEFIPVAEKTGLITRLGEWALLQGAACAARLRRRWPEAKVAINISRAQLTSVKLLDTLQAALICANLDPGAIELELTESLFMDMSPTVQRNIAAIRGIGLGLAIDDFGTGYSCLSNLKDLPATKLKLDRAFAIVLPEDKRAYTVVCAMTRLAPDLGMTVVAEGVETESQNEALREAGVDAVQGYLHAHPMAQDRLLGWLEGRAA